MKGAMLSAMREFLFALSIVSFPCDDAILTCSPDERFAGATTSICIAHYLL